MCSSLQPSAAASVEADFLCTVSSADGLRPIRLRSCRTVPYLSWAWRLWFGLRGRCGSRVAALTLFIAQLCANSLWSWLSSPGQWSTRRKVLVMLALTRYIALSGDPCRRRSYASYLLGSLHLHSPGPCASNPKGCSEPVRVTLSSTLKCTPRGRRDLAGVRNLPLTRPL